MTKVRFPEKVSLRYQAQVGSGAQKTSYPISTRGQGVVSLSPEIKLLRPEAPYLRYKP